MYIGDWPAARARFSPDQVAFVESPSGKRITYAHFYERTKALTNFFYRTLKLSKGDRVCILAHNCIEYLEIFFSLAKIGALSVPLPAGAPFGYLKAIIENAQSSILFHSASHASTAQELLEAGLFRKTFTTGCGGESEYERAAGMHYDEPVEEVINTLEDPLSLFYEDDGRRDVPGIIVSFGMAAWNAINTILAFALRETDSMILHFPLHSKAGLFSFTLPLFQAGGTTILEHDVQLSSEGGRSLDEKQTLLWVESEELGAFHGRNCAESSWYASLRFCAMPSPRGSSELPAWLSDSGIPLFRLFLLPQAGPATMIKKLDAEDGCGNSIGIPLFHVDAIIGDSKGNPLAEGEVGELLVRGHHLFSGYWNDPAMTRAAFLNGWLRTGRNAFCRNGLYFLAVDTCAPEVR